MGMLIITVKTHGGMVGFCGRRFESLPVQCHRRRRRHVHLTGVRTADQKTAASCTTIRPLPVTVYSASPLLRSKSATDENPNCVFLSNRT